MTKYNKFTTTLTSMESNLAYQESISSQYANRINGVIYILDRTSMRFVLFKAFLTDFSLNITPKVELTDSIFAVDPFMSRGQTSFSYAFTLNIPAESVSEAVDNTAKLQELYRYVGTLGNLSSAYITNDTHKSYDKSIESVVYFSNLINNCSLDAGLVDRDSDLAAEEIRDRGISGVIKSLEFKPNLEDGVFEARKQGLNVGTVAEDGAGLLAKNYELKIELFMTNSHESLDKSWPFMMEL